MLEFPDCFVLRLRPGNLQTSPTSLFTQQLKAPSTLNRIKNMRFQIYQSEFVWTRLSIEVS